MKQQHVAVRGSGKQMSLTFEPRKVDAMKADTHVDLIGKR